ncbi:MAG: PEGA domain-containing protein [Acidobacteria bacterium]|nr:PEGA domain-containing protein [Acidobacteriota bacterium]
MKKPAKYLSQAFAVLLCLTLFTYGQGNTFKDIRYQGGTLQTKTKPDDWGNRLTVSSDEIKLDLKDGQSVKIDPKHVTGLSYGQEAHRRVGTMIALAFISPIALFGLFHKKRDHFIGIEYNIEDGKKAGLLLQADKDNYRAVLVALRGATGAPIAVASDDRKYVPANVEVVISENKDNKKDGKDAASAKADAATGNIKIVSEPDGADVKIDGNFVGNAPSQLRLPVGKHTIQVSKEGFVDWSKELQVSAGADLNLKATLQKKD